VSGDEAIGKLLLSLYWSLLPASSARPVSIQASPKKGIAHEKTEKAVEECAFPPTSEEEGGKG